MPAHPQRTIAAPRSSAEPAADAAELRRREARFRSLVEHATEMLAIFALDGTTLYESPSNVGHVGWTPEELVGTSPFERIHPEDAERVAAAFARAAAEPDTLVQIEYRYRHREGSWRVLSSIGRNLAHDPDVGGIVVSSRDVTDERALEAQLRQAQKMEAIGRLAGGIAHDFANVLTALMMTTEALLAGRADGDGDGDGDATTRGLREILRTAERGVAITSRLLAVSRRQQLSPRPVDLNAVVSEMGAMLRRLIPPSVTMTTHLAPEPAVVRADAGHLEQVILNLAVNARDAMLPRGGTLTLETALASLDDGAARLLGVAPGDAVLLTVRDTGCGMSPEVRERLFEPFFTTKERTGGTGLGLSTVYGIVAQAGGAITVESEEGLGSTITVTLPRS